VKQAGKIMDDVSMKRMQLRDDIANFFAYRKAFPTSLEYADLDKEINDKLPEVNSMVDKINGAMLSLGQAKKDVEDAMTAIGRTPAAAPDPAPGGPSTGPSPAPTPGEQSTGPSPSPTPEWQWRKWLLAIGVPVVALVLICLAAYCFVFVKKSGAATPAPTALSKP